MYCLGENSELDVTRSNIPHWVFNESRGLALTGMIVANFVSRTEQGTGPIDVDVRFWAATAGSKDGRTLMGAINNNKN